MSFVTLEPFLCREDEHLPPATDNPKPSDLYFVLTGRILNAVNRYVLSGDALSDLSQDLEAIGLSLGPGSSSETLAIAAQRLTTLLQTSRERLQRADQENTEEFRKIIHLLNDTFSFLISGNERSDLRLKRLERSLQVAAKMDDIRNLKFQLSEILADVRQGTQSEASLTQEALQNLGSQIRLAQTSASKFRAKRPGREEAIAELMFENQRNQSSNDLYAALFVVPSLRAIRSRHGNEVADFLLEELARKNISPLANAGKLFNWSANALFMLWHSPKQLPDVSNSIANAIKARFKHRAFVGTRTATFDIDVKSLTVQARGEVVDLIRNLDRFSNGA